MKLSRRKRTRLSKNVVGRDRLSELPDEVIVHILSFMSTLDAVKTILLRRFGNLWTFVPNLELSIPEFFHTKDEFSYQDAKIEPDDVGRFYLFCDNVMKHHKSPSLHKCRLHVDSAFHAESVQILLRFALCKGAKEIRYRDASHDWIRTGSFLPSLTSQSLVTLELNYCTIDPEHQVNLGSLKTLILFRVDMCEGAFQRLLSGCPSLQELDITDPYDIETLSFTAKNIQKLTLDLDFEGHSCLLNFPNLQMLDLKSNGIQRITDASSVRDVFLRLFNHDMDEEERENYKLFLEKFKGAEAFELTSNGSELFLHSLDVLNLSEIKWKRVVLELWKVCESCLLGICELLIGLEHLEELVVRTRLTGVEETEFLRRVASFRRASASARVTVASWKKRHYKLDEWGDEIVVLT